MAKIIKVEFGASPYVAIQEMRDDIYEVIMNYAGTVPLAAVLGVLRIIEHEIIKQQDE